MAAYATYREAEILSSSPEQLVLLLYRGLLAHLKRGAECLSAGDLEGKAESFQRASAILYELIAALDHERGGELSGQLGALYGFFLREVSAASIARDRGRIDRVIEMVGRLNESWIEAAEQVGQTSRAPGRAAS